MAPPPTTFALELLGGTVEKRYRARRPQTVRLPWGSLDLNGCSDHDRQTAARWWTDLALQEYAAAADQADALRLAVRACAPLDLTAQLSQFPHDELAHTELCALVAAELGGSPPLQYHPDALFVAPPPMSDTPVRDVAVAAVRQFCVAESLTLAQVKLRHRQARQPLLRAVWAAMLKDEALHAQWGWQLLAWAGPLLTAADRAFVVAAGHTALHMAGRSMAQVQDLPADAFGALSIFGSGGKAAWMQHNLLTVGRIAGKLDAAFG